MPKEYGTTLCVGNYSTETPNNQFFIHKGYSHRNSLFRMNRNLNEPIPDFKLDEEFQFSHWKMESSQEEQEYLEIEAEIWPDTPLGMNRLSQYKHNKLWTSMNVRIDDTIAGSLMSWQEEDIGAIEDVFVREPWRKRGLAKYLLAQALNYLKSHGLENAQLEVEVTNKSALSLYEFVGFYPKREEIRYYIDL